VSKILTVNCKGKHIFYGLGGMNENHFIPFQINELTGCSVRFLCGLMVLLCQILVAVGIHMLEDI
jgi:hypothetical protein